jgi:predicted SprT family Zn-dependent metalloprotease
VCYLLGGSPHLSFEFSTETMIARQCPNKNCGQSTFEPFVDEWRSLLQNVFPPSIIRSIITSARRNIADIPEAELQMCKQCNQFGYTCPNCDRSVPLNAKVNDGGEFTCIHCRKQVMVRDAMHFLKWRWL